MGYFCALFSSLMMSIETYGQLFASTSVWDTLGPIVQATYSYMEASVNGTQALVGEIKFLISFVFYV